MDAGNSVALKKLRITEEIQEAVWITGDLETTGVHVGYGWFFPFDASLLLLQDVL